MEVLVIGAGIIGTGIALRLAQEGVKVTQLERGAPGAEATNAAGGIVGPQVEAHEPGPGLELALRSRSMYPKFVAELEQLSSVKIELRACGVLKAALSEADLPALAAIANWQKQRQLSVELLDGRQARSLEPALSQHIPGAVHFPEDLHVDNRALMRALTVAACRCGVVLRTGSARKLLVEDGRAVGVDVDGEQLRADVVVLAAGAWSSLLEGSGLGARSVKPVRGQMVELKTHTPPLSRVIFSPKGYLVPRPDGRLLVGSTMEQAGFQKNVTVEGAARLLAMAQEVCPMLSGASVQGHWAGFRPTTQDHLPLLGQGPIRRLFIFTGHFRSGILLAPITSRLGADLVLGRSAELDLSPFRIDRPAAA